VYAQNPDMVLKMREGANDKAISKRLAGNRLANVVHLDRELTDLDIQSNTKRHIKKCPRLRRYRCGTH
jgi:hypothetical protein